MTCQELSDFYELFALALADEPERSEIEEHLSRGCPNCVPGVRRARTLNAGMLMLVPDAVPPARLRRRILASVGAEPARGWMLAWAAAAAAIGVVAIIYLGQLRRAHRDLAETRAQLERSVSELNATAAERARLLQEMELLQQPDTEEVTFGGAAARPPRGRVIVSARGGILLIASNLPPAPEGRTYEMWLVPKSGGPQPAGLFQSAASGTAIYFRPGPVDRSQTAAVAVSVEPAAGSPAPTTTPFIVAKL